MKGLLIVFKNTRYTFLAFVLFLFFVLVITLLPNINLLKIVLFSSNSLAVKIEFIFSLLFSFRERASLFTLAYTLVISVLSAVGLSLSIYGRKIHQVKNMGLGFLGTLATFLGIGCMACGSLLLTTIATYFGIGALIVYLPYKGEELGFIGILLLIFSIYFMSKNVDKNLVCKV